MNSEKRQKVIRTIKTALLAVAITFLLVFMVAENKKNTAKSNSREVHTLEQKISKLETALRESASWRSEMLSESKKTNRTLRMMLSELRGIHNDCQRNATENFLHPQRNHNAR